MECPKCKRQDAYLRLTTNEIVCRNCGTITKQDNPKIKDKKVKDNV